MTTDRDQPFRIAVLGNFRGDAAPRTGPLRAVRVDRDNFDSVLRELNVRLDGVKVGASSEPLTIHFAALEDFHPDRLFEKLAMFAPLRALRSRLQDPATFDEAAKELLILGGQGAQISLGPALSQEAASHNDAARQHEAPHSSDFADESSLLDQMLEPEIHATASDSPQPQNSTNEWQRMIHSIVAPYLVAGADPRKAELLGVVDDSLQALMSTVLHHPDFQALEASWRALHLLVHRLETDAQLCVHFIDISRAELMSDLMGSTDISRSSIYRILVEETLEVDGGEPWSLLVGDYTFGSGDEDASGLRQLAKIAAVAEAPLMAAADFRQLQSVSGESWQLLRRSVEAGYVALVWPRFLLRLPYGAETNPIDAFSYEELPAAVNEPQLLWGNSAYLCALLFGQAFAENGWATTPWGHCQVDRLPVWMFKRDGEVELHPCGERLLTDSMAVQLRQLGITPLISIRDRDTVRIPSVIGLNSEKLLGRWEA